MKNRRLAVQAEHELMVMGFTPAEAETLRRAAVTMHRWHEQECGDGNSWASWAIEWDDETGIPYRCTYPHQGPSRRERIADRYTPARERAEAIAKAHGMSVRVQSDPRGLPLYLVDGQREHGVAPASF